jgi:hypothetical protein
MKIIKINFEKKTKSGFNSNSFERFGDDLCELLLSYLSISDKIHFECVSKQWQRLVFNKQNKLILKRADYYSVRFDRIVIPLKFWNENKILIIECLTKKFKFIYEFKIDSGIIVNKVLLEIIAKNCQYLRKIAFYGLNIGEYYEIFGQKCGQKLESFDIWNINNEELVSLLRSTHNLKALKVDERFAALIEQYLPKLEEIKIMRFSGEGFEDFADLYNKQIKKISFEYPSKEWDKKVIPYLSRFERLESLYLGTFRHVFNEDFISMAENLKNLKRFTIRTDYLNQSFERLNVFNNLQTFELIVSYIISEEDMKVIETLNLTKLQINIIVRKNCSTEQTLKKLAKMERLSELRLTFEEISASLVYQLIKNSPKLKNIELNDKHINETTIKAFVEKALNNPKIYYRLIARESKRKNRMTLNNRNLPKNLLIQKLI